MVRSSKRVTRKDIRQPDRFIVLTGKLAHSFAEHRTVFLTSLGLVIALFLSLWGWDLYSSRQDRLAAQDYSRALTLYHNGNFRQALDTLAQVDFYGSSTYNHLSLLYQANSYIALKQPAKALEILRESAGKEAKEPFLGQLSFLTLGYIQEKSGQCQEAEKSFSEAEKLMGPFTEMALLGKARCSAKNGDFKEALNLYREYLSSYPGSEREVEISLRIQELEPKIKESPSGR